MRILIIGGTIFLGRYLVEAALREGHQVTLFNRGQHNPELFSDVEKLQGNRDGGLQVLAGREWDAAIDTCGYVPRVVRASARFLAGAVRHYTFISSLSVYADNSIDGLDESGAVGRLEDPATEEITNETYGPLKALCEEAAEAAMPGRTLVIRPGLIVGPHDPTGRFSYWPHRVAAGGEILAPGRPERVIQFIDVRDLAGCTLQMVEKALTGRFNANGPDYSLTMGRFLETCREVSGQPARFTWVDEKFLLEKGVGPWMELPLWIPESEPEMAGFFKISSARAINAGLTFRPLAETVRATLQWLATRPAGHNWPAGLKPEREQALLAEYHKLKQD